MSDSTPRQRYLPNRKFPPYAYLPGHFAHPVRASGGHSYGLTPLKVAQGDLFGSKEFLWGMDLFNHGYYWEAHEAWEGLWQTAQGDQRLLFKGLILLCASGVKVRERKIEPALRHAGRAAEVFFLLPKSRELNFAKFIGMRPSDAAASAIAAVLSHPASSDPNLLATPVFPFVLHSASTVF